MKVVASRDFANVTALGLGPFTDAAGKLLTPSHKSMVHKGSRFDIGTTDVVADLSAGDKLKLVQLLPTGGAACIVFASDTAMVKKIDAEVAEAKAKAKADEDTVAAPALGDILAALKQQSDAMTLLMAVMAKK